MQRPRRETEKLQAKRKTFASQEAGSVQTARVYCWLPELAYEHLSE